MFHFDTELLAHTHNIAMSVPKIKDLLTFSPRKAAIWLKLVLGFSKRGEGFNRVFTG